MAFYQVTVAQSHTYKMKAMNAILDAFRTSDKFNLFVVEIFFVNHSKGHNTTLGAVSYERKTETRQQNTLYSGGDFPFPFTQSSVGQLFVMIVDEKDLDSMKVLK